MTIIMRSALVAWGRKDIRPDLHSIIDGRVVTWSDVMTARRVKQEHNLSWKLRSHEKRAWKVWVSYFDMSLMGGWHAFIEHYRPDFDLGRVWIDRDRRQLKAILMRTFPLVLAIGTEGDQWAAWKIAFARQYRRRSQDGQPVGVAYVWWDKSDAIEPISGVR